MACNQALVAVIDYSSPDRLFVSSDDDSMMGDDDSICYETATDDVDEDSHMTIL